MTITCTNEGLYGAAEGKRCARPADHLGAHRDTARVHRFATVQWGDNEGTFRPCADCRTPITCAESGEDRCP